MKRVENYKKMDKRHFAIIEVVFEKLKEYEPFIYATSGSSTYIHFKKIDHKLRISNHEERAKYGYKWQMRIDGVPKDKKPFRNYHDNVNELCRHFLHYYKKIEKKAEGEMVVVCN